jgi:hypothetical protein
MMEQQQDPVYPRRDALVELTMASGATHLVVLSAKEGTEAGQNLSVARRMGLGAGSGDVIQIKGEDADTWVNLSLLESFRIMSFGDTGSYA